jgi:AraC family transcriptional regulator
MRERAIATIKPVASDSMSNHPVTPHPHLYNVANYVAGVGIYSAMVPPASFAEHAHPEIEISIPFSGASCPSTFHGASGTNITQRLSAERVSICPGNQPHSGVWEQSAEILLLYVHPSFLLRAAEDVARSDAFELIGDPAADDRFIRQLGAALHTELHTGGLPGRLFVESLAHVLAVHLLRRHTTHQPRSVYCAGRRLSAMELRRIHAYIDAHLAHDITLHDLAATIAMSPSRFRSLFKQSTGLPPYQYVIHKRVERAQQLLLQHQWTPREVALHVGFADQSHMNRHMKRLLGVTPKALRQQRQNVLKSKHNVQEKQPDTQV